MMEIEIDDVDTQPMAKTLARYIGGNVRMGIMEVCETCLWSAKYWHSYKYWTKQDMTNYLILFGYMVPEHYCNSPINCKCTCKLRRYATNKQAFRWSTDDGD